MADSSQPETNELNEAILETTELPLELNELKSEAFEDEWYGNEWLGRMSNECLGPVGGEELPMEPSKSNDIGSEWLGLGPVGGEELPLESSESTDVLTIEGLSCYEALLEAVCNGSLAGLHGQFEKAELEEKDKHGQTPLHLAAASDHVEIVKFLFDAGADLNAKDKLGQTSLMIASAKGYTEVAEFLRDSTMYSNCDECKSADEAALVDSSSTAHHVTTFSDNCPIKSDKKSWNYVMNCASDPSKHVEGNPANPIQDYLILKSTVCIERTSMNCFNDDTNDIDHKT